MDCTKEQIERSLLVIIDNVGKNGSRENAKAAVASKNG